jgi:hypothetical protein
VCAGVVEGARARLSADPDFLFKLGVEVRVAGVAGGRA